jgi:hypothetical protein
MGEDGRCVGMTTRLSCGPNDASFAEAPGLQEALTLIDKLHLSKVIIELDAECVVRAIASKIFPRN